ncbi:MAG: hypothetical protein IJW51_01495 [Clostridia bacterium]|nr:hypothetical protein [Clostridia bacterium]
MRRSKVLMLLSLALACVMLLSSCAWGGSYKKLFGEDAYRDPAPTVTVAEQVATLSGAYYEDGTDTLQYLTDTVTSDGRDYDKHIVYNMATNTVVYEVTNTLTADFDVELGTVNGVSFFIVTATTWQLVENIPSHYEYKTSLYTAAGSLLTEAKGRIDVSIRVDLIEFDGKCYRAADDGVIAEAFSIGDFAALPTLTDRSEKYYYNIDVSNKQVTVYDLACTPTASFTAPSYAMAMIAYVLAGGDVLVQYIVVEPDDAKDYSFVMSTTGLTQSKCSLYTVLLDAKKDKTKELKLDYLIEDMLTCLDEDWADYYGYDDRYDNLAKAYEIADGRVDTASSARVLLAVSNSGKVKAALKDAIPAQIATFPVQVANNRWLVRDNLDREYLVNEKGKLVGEVTGADDYNSAYCVAAGKLYDFDLNLVHDFEEAGQEIYEGTAGYGIMNHGVLLENGDEEIICYTNGAATTVVAKDSSRTLYVIEDNYFVVRDYTDAANVKYELYNDVGVKLASFDYAPDTVAWGEDGTFLITYMQNDGIEIYYRCH